MFQARCFAPASTMCARQQTVLLQVRKAAVTFYFLQLCVISSIYHPAVPPCGSLQLLGSCRTWISLWSLAIISIDTLVAAGWSDTSSQRQAPVTVSLTFCETNWRLSSKVSRNKAAEICGQQYLEEWAPFIRDACVVAGVLEMTSEADRDAIKKAKVLYNSCMNESNYFFI